MPDFVEQNLEQPRPAIGSRLEPMKGFPRLQVHLLYKILSFCAIPDKAHCRSIQIVQVRHGYSLKFSRLHFSSKFRYASGNLREYTLDNARPLMKEVYAR